MIGGRTGRGTYLCPDVACVERALQTRALTRRLRGSVDAPNDLAEQVQRGLTGGLEAVWLVGSPADGEAKNRRNRA